jgi:hypothetical protein
MLTGDAANVPNTATLDMIEIEGIVIIFYALDVDAPVLYK